VLIEHGEEVAGLRAQRGALHRVRTRKGVPVQLLRPRQDMAVLLQKGLQARRRVRHRVGDFFV
jgi:hypothetical protein